MLFPPIFKNYDIPKNKLQEYEIQCKMRTLCEIFIYEIVRLLNLLVNGYILLIVLKCSEFTVLYDSASHERK